MACQRLAGKKWQELFKEEHETQREQDKQTQHADAAHLFDNGIQTTH